MHIGFSQTLLESEKRNIQIMTYNTCCRGSVASVSFFPKVIISLVPCTVPAQAVALLVFLQHFNKPTCNEKCGTVIGVTCLR